MTKKTASFGFLLVGGVIAYWNEWTQPGTGIIVMLLFAAIEVVDAIRDGGSDE